MVRVGYSTGTFDLAHRGHFRILKCMKLLCDTLIIGLTTDELAEKQKRKTIVSFEDRRSVLENCKWVDAVVEHNGDDKKTALGKLGFDILFIGDDYYGKDEYKDVEDMVKIVYIPRSSCTCTSDIVKRIEHSFLNRWTLFNNGISGPLYSFDDNVIKPVHVAYVEVGNTSDNFNIAINPPRNWKGSKTNFVHPMIAGVNANREIEIQKIIKDFEWCTYIDSKVSVSSNFSKTNNIVEARKSPKEVHWIIQKNAGNPIGPMWESYDLEDKKEIIDRVRTIADDLKALSIVHGDIHLNNLLIDYYGNISLIDFGWCSHISFDMKKEEYESHMKKIEDDWDWKHFKRSIPSVNELYK